jgi:group I intron endonuclease
MNIVERLLNGVYSFDADTSNLMESSKVPGIYAIVNKQTGLVYIGQTINFRKRKIAHLYGLRNKKHRNKWLQEDYNQSGESGFLFLILEFCLSEALCDREQYYFDLFEYKYNVILFSDRSLFTKQHRENLSKSHIGNKHTEEAKLKIGAASKGNKFRQGVKLSEEHKQKAIAALKRAKPRRGAENPLFGKKRAEEVMEKCVASRKAKYGNSMPGNYKAITQYTKDGAFIKDWDSLKSAAVELRIGPSRISDVIAGRHKSVHGYVFKFKHNAV